MAVEVLSPERVPGSIAFSLLKNKANLDYDILDAEQLKKQWISHFCEVDYDTIMDYSEKILGLGEYTITIKRESERKHE